MVISWSNGELVSDYNYNGQAGEDFEEDLTLPNIDFGTYHIYVYSWYPQLIYAGSNFSAYEWGLQWIQQHADAAKKKGKPVILEEFGVPTYQDKLAFYPGWVQKALDTNHGIMPWQYGQLGLTESGGNRVIKYADAIIDGPTRSTKIKPIFGASLLAQPKYKMHAAAKSPSPITKSVPA
ncbi:hypothetical protein FRC20_008269 [Serendipita sp. 405]|nr:hypothetical protein FRC20_008269 [Serendipita sp. 405]